MMKCLEAQFFGSNLDRKPCPFVCQLVVGQDLWYLFRDDERPFGVFGVHCN